MVTLQQGSTSPSADDLSTLKQIFSSVVRISNLVSYFLLTNNMNFFTGNLAGLYIFEKSGDGQQVEED